MLPSPAIKETANGIIQGLAVSVTGFAVIFGAFAARDYWNKENRPQETLRTEAAQVLRGEGYTGSLKEFEADGKSTTLNFNAVRKEQTYSVSVKCKPHGACRLKSVIPYAR